MNRRENGVGRLATRCRPASLCALFTLGLATVASAQTQNVPGDFDIPPVDIPDREDFDIPPIGPRIDQSLASAAGVDPRNFAPAPPGQQLNCGNGKCFYVPDNTDMDCTGDECKFTDSTGAPVEATPATPIDGSPAAAPPDETASSPDPGEPASSPDPGEPAAIPEPGVGGGAGAGAPAPSTIGIEDPVSDPGSGLSQSPVGTESQPGGSDAPAPDSGAPSAAAASAGLAAVALAALMM